MGDMHLLDSKAIDLEPDAGEVERDLQKLQSQDETSL